MMPYYFPIALRHKFEPEAAWKLLLIVSCVSLHMRPLSKVWIPIHCGMVEEEDT